MVSQADDVDVVMSDETLELRLHGRPAPCSSLEEGNKAVQGLATGGAPGAGGVRAALAAMFVVRCLDRRARRSGSVIAVTTAAAWVGAGAGAATGRIIGALVGAGIPEASARLSTSAGLRRAAAAVGDGRGDDEHAAELERAFQSWHGGTGVRLQGSMLYIVAWLLGVPLSVIAALVLFQPRCLRLVAAGEPSARIAGRCAGRGSRATRSRSCSAA